MEFEVGSRISEDVARTFRAGDLVKITGELVVARDQAHRRLIDEFRTTGRLPLDLRDRIIYYCGPTLGVFRGEGVAGSVSRSCLYRGAAGPTTSARMDKFAMELHELGVRATIGKGTRSPMLRQALSELGCLYLVTVGGAGAYLGKFVKKCKVVAYEDLGPEALMLFEVKGFPTWVAYDTKGGSIFTFESA